MLISKWHVTFDCHVSLAHETVMLGNRVSCMHISGPCQLKQTNSQHRYRSQHGAEQSAR
jgi:hypothetical protein